MKLITLAFQLNTVPQTANQNSGNWQLGLSSLVHFAVPSWLTVDSPTVAAGKLASEINAANKTLNGSVVAAAAVRDVVMITAVVADNYVVSNFSLLNAAGESVASDGATTYSSPATLTTTVANYVADSDPVSVTADVISALRAGFAAGQRY